MTSNPQSLPIGTRILDAREAKGLTLEQLADRLGVRTETVKSWETNEVTPRANRLTIIAGVLDVPLLWLIEGSEDHEPAARGTRVDIVAQKLERVVSMQDELARLISEISTEVAEIQRIEAELDELAA